MKTVLRPSRRKTASCKFHETACKFHENRCKFHENRCKFHENRFAPFTNLFVGSVSVVRGSGDFGLGIGSVPADRCALRLITATHCFESFVEFGGHFA